MGTRDWLRREKRKERVNSEGSTRSTRIAVLGTEFSNKLTATSVEGQVFTRLEMDTRGCESIAASQWRFNEINSNRRLGD